MTSSTMCGMHYNASHGASQQEIHGSLTWMMLGGCNATYPLLSLMCPTFDLEPHIYYVTIQPFLGPLKKTFNCSVVWTLAPVARVCFHYGSAQLEDAIFMGG